MVEKTQNDEGQILKTLIFNSGMEHREVARAIGKHPNYLSRILSNKKLSTGIKREASILFKVPIEVFENPSFLNNNTVEENKVNYVSRADMLDNTLSVLAKNAEQTTRLLELQIQERNEWQKERVELSKERQKLLEIIENLTNKK